MHASQFGINVQNVLAEEVVSSDNGDDDSFEALLNSRPSSRQFSSTSGASKGSYAQRYEDEDDGDDEDTDDDDDDDDDDGGKGGGERHHGDGTYYQGTYYRDVPSQRPFSPFSEEDRYTHATQDADHGSRGANIGLQASGSIRQNANDMLSDHTEDYLAGTLDTMSISSQPRSLLEDIDNTSSSLFGTFDTMSISTQPRSPVGPLENAANASWSQNSHTGSTGSHSNYGVDVSGDHITPQWVNRQYPLVGELVQINRETYFRHISSYIDNFSTMMSWNAYCHDRQACEYGTHFEQPRSSFWY